MNIKIWGDTIVKIKRSDLRNAFYKPKWIPRFVWKWFIKRMYRKEF